MDIRQILMDRIAEQLDDSEMLTPAQMHEVQLLGIREGARVAIQYQNAYLQQRFEDANEPDLIEILIETVRDRVRAEMSRDF